MLIVLILFLLYALLLLFLSYSFLYFDPGFIVHSLNINLQSCEYPFCQFLVHRPHLFNLRICLIVLFFFYFRKLFYSSKKKNCSQTRLNSPIPQQVLFFWSIIPQEVKRKVHWVQVSTLGKIQKWRIHYQQLDWVFFKFNKIILKI